MLPSSTAQAAGNGGNDGAPHSCARYSRRRVGKQRIVAPYLLRKKSTFADLGLALLIDLSGKRLGADFLAVKPAVSVRVTDPPDSGSFGPLEGAPFASLYACHRLFAGLVDYPLRPWDEEMAGRSESAIIFS